MGGEFDDDFCHSDGFTLRRKCNIFKTQGLSFKSDLLSN